MKRVLAVFLAILVSVGGCNSVGTDCGPFPNAFKTTGFSSAAVRVDSLRSTSGRPLLSQTEGDTLRAGQFGIRMDPKIETYFTETRRTQALSFVTSVYACSPVVPSSEEVIEDLRIYADADFGPEYEAGDNLAPFFDVIALYEADDGHRRFDLLDFLAQSPNAAHQLVLLLDTPPATTRSVRFTVEYEQKGPGIENYMFTTDPVVLQVPGSSESKLELPR